MILEEVDSTPLREVGNRLRSLLAGTWQYLARKFGSHLRVILAVAGASDSQCDAHDVGGDISMAVIGSMSVAAPCRPRMVDGYLAQLLGEWPAVMITGASATGKTTTRS